METNSVKVAKQISNENRQNLSERLTELEFLKSQWGLGTEEE
jgi:hypothetical protein